MVPLSQRRHRLHGDEVPDIIEALAMLLVSRVRSGEGLERTKPAFRAFYRLLEHRTGRPNYPEPVTWDVIAEWIHFYRMGRGG